MIYPQNFEIKIGFNLVREMLTDQCLSALGKQKVEEMEFSSIYSKVNKALNETNEFVRILQEEDDFPDQYFFDVRSSLKRIKVEGMTEIMKWCETNGRSYWEYVKQCEESNIWDYLADVWNQMKASVENGLEAEGVLPGPPKFTAKSIHVLYKSLGVQKIPSIARIGLCIRPGGE
jgi:hypothetical protein